MTEDKIVIEKLADIIEANPKCQFEIDNDCWWITNGGENYLATSDDYPCRPEWYSYGNTYGSALAAAHEAPIKGRSMIGAKLILPFQPYRKKGAKNFLLFFKD